VGPSPEARLAADVERHVEEARERYGTKGRVRVVGGLFVLVDAGAAGPLYDRAADLVERALPPLFHDRFSKRPEEAVTVVLFTDHGALTKHLVALYGAASPQWGSYHRSTREIAVDLSRGEAFLPTLTHEIVHPLVETDFPGAPMWIDEAIATMLEAPRWDADGGVHGVRWNVRSPELSLALAEPKKNPDARLDALFGMPSLRFLARASADAGAPVDSALFSLHYATVRSVACWLDEQGKLWPFYRAWRGSVDTDPTGRASFEAVMGASPEALNDAWARWAR
jgi:hypothetical protein